MLCQSCGKRPAVTQIQTNHNGVVSEYHLCLSCAKKLGYQGVKEAINPFFDFQSLLGNFFGEPVQQKTETVCPTCGATMREISQSGKVGCADCYTVFRQQLLPSIQRMHGNTKHSGKVPTGMAMQVMPQANLAVAPQPAAKPAESPVMQEKRKALQKAIAEENFEAAAVLRDEIRRLEAEQGGV